LSIVYSAARLKAVEDVGLVKTIYLDHNIIHYFVKGFPAGVDSAIEVAACADARGSSPTTRFVLSEWNLVEIAHECAGGHMPAAAADRYADFLEDLDPIFVDGKDSIQRTEILAFMRRRSGGTPPTLSKGWMFATHYSQIVSSRVREILVGFDLRKCLRHLSTTPSSLLQFQGPRRVALRALEATTAAYNAGIYGDKALQRTILEAWLFSLIPERDQGGLWIDLGERRRLAQEWSHAPRDLFFECPAIYAESCLTDFRAAGGGRIPKDSDSVDLMHAIPALAYCDAFVLNDKHLRRLAERVCDRIARKVVIESKLSTTTTRL
jgi:hypothetical protein